MQSPTTALATLGGLANEYNLPIDRNRLESFFVMQSPEQNRCIIRNETFSAIPTSGDQPFPTTQRLAKLAMVGIRNTSNNK
jgi:hypothetical protein